jgi:hypothetical protein
VLHLRGMLLEFMTERTMDGVLEEAGNRSIEGLELEREGMLIELLTPRSGREQAAAASGGTPARSK